MQVNEVVTGFSSLTTDEKKQAVREIDTIIGKPRQGVRDALWLVVVLAFAVVLIGSFATLARGVFVKPLGTVSPDLILAMFTSVVGFLAGLFSPSPIANQGNL